LTVQVACPEFRACTWQVEIGEPPCEKATVPWVFKGETLGLLLATDTVAVRVTDWPYTDEPGLATSAVCVASATVREPLELDPT